MGSKAGVFFYACHTKSKSNLFMYIKFLQQTFHDYKITIWICVLVLWIHKGYLVMKSWCEMFVLKLSGIQRILYTYCSLNLTEKEIVRHAMNIIESQLAPGMV